MLMIAGYLELCIKRRVLEMGAENGVGLIRVGRVGTGRAMNAWTDQET